MLIARFTVAALIGVAIANLGLRFEGVVVVWVSITAVMAICICAVAAVLALWSMFFFVFDPERLIAPSTLVEGVTIEVWLSLTLFLGFEGGGVPVAWIRHLWG